VEKPFQQIGKSSFFPKFAGMKHLYVILLVCLLPMTDAFAQSPLETLRENAEKGDVNSQCLLGYWYETGNQVPKDEQQAMRWYLKAADSGYAFAQYSLGRMYATAVGVEKDDAKAFAWYMKAAENGYAEAQEKVGEAYHHGTWVQKNAVKAIEWYQKAADQGLELAIRNLEICRSEVESASSNSASNPLAVSNSSGTTLLKPTAKEDTEKVYDVVENQPSFQGGQKALQTWIKQNIQYPFDAWNAKIQGRVIVSFVVQPDGSLSNIKVERSVEPSLDEEAVRLIQSMPKWNPGMQNGKAVKTRYNLPVSFKID
jgi:TonB family protein